MTVSFTSAAFVSAGAALGASVFTDSVFTTGSAFAAGSDFTVSAAVSATGAGTGAVTGAVLFLVLLFLGLAIMIFLRILIYNFYSITNLAGFVKFSGNSFFAGVESIVLCEKIYTVLVHTYAVTSGIFRKLLMQAFGKSELELS